MTFAQKKPRRPGSTICYGRHLPRKSHKPTNARQYGLSLPAFAQKEPPRTGSTICCGRHSPRKSHQDPAARFVTAGICSERANKSRQYDLLRLTLARKSHQDPAIRFVTTENAQTKSTKTRQYVYCGRHLRRKSHQDPAERFVTSGICSDRLISVRQYDLVRPTACSRAFSRPSKISLWLVGMGQCVLEAFSNACCSWEGVQVAKSLPCMLQQLPFDPCAQLQHRGLWGLYGVFVYIRSVQRLKPVYSGSNPPSPLPAPPRHFGLVAMCGGGFVSGLLVGFRTYT